MWLVPADQLSLAIGKEGQNVRLAARLTGWKIDIKDTAKYDYDAENQKFAEIQATKEAEATAAAAIREAEAAEIEALAIAAAAAGSPGFLRLFPPLEIVTSTSHLPRTAMANSEDIDLTEDYEADSDEDFEVDDADSDAGEAPEMESSADSEAEDFDAEE